MPLSQMVGGSSFQISVIADPILRQNHSWLTRASVPGREYE